ncbi:MAG: ABC transporter permease [Vicinamibacterales bacterium]
MKGFLLRAVVRIAVPRPLRDQAALTLSDVCRAARERGGRWRAWRAAALELGDLGRASLMSGLGRGPRVTITASGAVARRQSFGRRGGPSMFIDDLRRALRRLVAQPAPALGAVLMLALAIGLATAMFSLIDTLLMRTVPFPQAERLAHVMMLGPSGGSISVDPSVLHAWRESRLFDRVEAQAPATMLLGSGADLTSSKGAYVSPGLLQMLGARPINGRLFSPEEGRPGTGDRVVIAERLWRSMFGADLAAIGTRMLVEGSPATLIGVLPDEFRFPEWDTAVWRPMDFLAPPAGDRPVLPRAIVRYSPGIPAADALKAATTMAHEAYPPQADNQWAQAESLASPYQGKYARAAAPVLAAAAVMVFLVLCANVSGLLLARLDARMREIGVAAALGASRGRLMREALVESLCLGAGGLALGLAVAAGLLTIARAWLPEALLIHTLNPIDLDARAFAAASAAGGAAVLAAGLLPAWFATRVSPMSAMRPAARGSSEGRGSRAARRVLLVSEVAFACMLLVGASLLVRSFMRMAGAERGLDSSGVTTAWVQGIGGQDATGPARVAASRRLEEALRQLPGVQAVAFSFGTPPDGGGWTMGEWVSDGSSAAPIEATFQQYQVGPDFFDLYRIPIVRGRTFRTEDHERTVVISERIADLLWPGVDPVGRSFHREGKEPFTVIGVARELHLPTTETRSDRPEFYLQFVPGRANVSINIRCGGPCPDVARIRQTVRDVEPRADVWQAGVLDRAYLAEVEGPRAAAALVLTLALIAAVAVGGGLFAVLSYAAGRRRREFGIRLALGARPGEIGGLMLREGARVVVAGAVIGGLGAWWLSRALSSLMYGVTPGDPGSWLMVAGLLIVIALAASWRPAARAARIDPSMLLREE